MSTNKCSNSSEYQPEECVFLDKQFSKNRQLSYIGTISGR